MGKTRRASRLACGGSLRRTGTRAAVTGAMLMTALVLAGCGGGGGETVPGPVGSDPATGTPTNPTPAPAPGTSDPGGGLGAAPVAGTAPASYTISGKVALAETSEVDADTNDPLQVNRRSNDAIDTAQAITNPTLLIGYLNVPGQGPDGPLRQNGDVVDVYRTTLQAGQTVEIDFAADPSTIDVDLGIFDLAGNVVGASIGLNSYECVSIAAAGEYLVAPLLYTRNNASTGGTVYQMRIGAPGTSSACPNATQPAAGVVAGEVIAQLAPSPTVAAKAAHAPLARPVVLKGELAESRPALLQVPLDVDAALASGGMSTTVKAAAGGVGGWHLGANLPSSTQRVLATLDYAKSLQRSGLYKYAVANTTVSAYQVQQFPPNDRDYPKQKWHYESIDLTGAINLLAAQSPQPTYVPIVAVIDTGIVADHPDLTNQLVPGFDFVRDASESGDGNGIDSNADDADTEQSAVFHGSHVAGTIAAQTWNSIGGAGVAPMAKVMPVRVLSNGSGTSYDVLQGVRFAAGLPNDSNTVPARKADVLNLSLGGNRPCQPDQLELFAQVRQAGVIATIASGNESTSTRLTAVGAPANCPNVIAVGATDALRQRARYSNGGPELMVVAPGGDVRASTTGNGLPDGIYSTSAEVSNGTRTPTFISINGTSMAAPHAAGIVALMRFVAPNITPAQIDDLISAGTIVDDLLTPGRDTQTGFGQLNARKAVEAARQIAGGAAPPPVAGVVTPRPSTLSLGSTRETIEFELVASGATTEQVASVVADAATISVAPKAGTVGVNGLGTYVVTANRGSLAVGGSAFPNVVVTMSPARTVRIPVTVERRSATSAGGNLGPIYVLVADADSPDVKPIAQANVNAPVAGVYTYTVTVPGASRVFVIAGTDTDNDGAICNRGEGCGAYPILGTQTQAIEPRGNLTDIDFSMAPFGGINPSSSPLVGSSQSGTLELLGDPSGPRTGMARLK